MTIQKLQKWSYFWIHKLLNVAVSGSRKCKNGRALFLDPEIVKMVRFLDPEIVKMVDRSFMPVLNTLNLAKKTPLKSMGSTLPPLGSCIYALLWYFSKSNCFVLGHEGLYRRGLNAY